MAERRMFTQKIVDSDAFLDMPLSAQALYFHLNMRADDDGFVNNPKKIQRMIGASDDDLKLLIAKRFLLCFDSGIIVIKHWRMHNLLRKDRYCPTQYQDEMALLELKDNKSYTEKSVDNHTAAVWQPLGNHLATQVSIGEYREVKESIGENRGKPVPAPPEPDFDEIKELYNSLCPSLPSAQVISDETRQQLIATLDKYSVEALKETFARAECSAFLKGKNKRKWVACFDWLITPEHVAKVLNGNYDDRNSGASFNMQKFKEKAEELPVYKTAADDEGLRQRAEQLKKQISNL